MKKLSLTLILCLVWAGWAWAHGDISQLPNSVQIMQYRLLLYMTPDDPAPRNSLAMALYRTNQLEEAEKELRYILKRDSLNFDALNGLGIVLIKMGRCQEALKYLEKAVGINEEDVMIHVHLSVVYQKMKLPERARSELEKARSLTSDPIELENIEKELQLVTGP
jgi:tetratricopeptide (TPR) repeat protein